MSGDETQFVNGILLLYHHPLRQGASTIMEHVNAFKKYSHFNVWNVNTELGFPEGLKRAQFKTLVLHYSLFVPPRYYLDKNFLNYIDTCPHTYKIAFFQDEHRFCQQRFAFINRCKIDCVYTLLEPQYFSYVYQKYTKVKKLIYTLPGYVSEDLIAVAQKMRKSENGRKIDVGYRARQLSFYMGEGAQEKHEIGIRFRERANASGLKTDIETDERRRIYGRRWYEFLANCRAVLGVEAGVSIFDLEDKVRLECERLISENPRIGFDEVSKSVLQPWEGNVPYRTISPRHFEAAAFHVCQILFEGRYSGIMQPMVHYIPLKKDFSNFDDAILMFKDSTLRSELTKNAYQDLIESGKYSYRRFVQEIFDKSLSDSGLKSAIANKEAEDVTAFLKKYDARRYFYAAWRSLRYRPFPGREYIIPLARWVLRASRRLKRSGFWNMSSKNA
jgi:hypothetical protein